MQIHSQDIHGGDGSIELTVQVSLCVCVCPCVGVCMCSLLVDVFSVYSFKDRVFAHTTVLRLLLLPPCV